MSYCNSGPPVAAYIVEKLTGQTYEDYIQHNFFDPMGMENMTYFANDTYKSLGATLYQDGEPVDYWHIIQRPSGSINASPKDMAKMVSFFIHRGIADSVQLISQESLDRMETPSTTSGARAGLETGYGLNNYSITHQSFVYRGHNGGVMGGLTDLAYLPEHQFGHAIMINSGSGEALDRIIKLVMDFQTQNLDANKVITKSGLTDQHKAVSGYYRLINPRIQMLNFLERLMSVQRIWHEQDTIFRNGLLGGNISKYIPTAGGQFQSAETGLVSMVQTTDPLAGEVVHVGSLVVKRISAVLAFVPIIMGTLWLLFMFCSLVFALIWPIRYW
jgi:hypothetical protein